VAREFALHVLGSLLTSAARPVGEG
jgi:hypothetical protein